jgi:hypothetical protein
MDLEFDAGAISLRRQVRIGYILTRHEVQYRRMKMSDRKIGKYPPDTSRKSHEDHNNHCRLGDQ